MDREKERERMEIFKKIYIEIKVQQAKGNLDITNNKF